MQSDSHGDLERVSSVFGALSSPTRLRMLFFLSETKRPLHIKAVSKQLGIDYAACYRHVETLEKTKLIEIYEVGRSRVLSIKDPERLKQLLRAAGLSQREST
ncbi:MAG: winged helix-turn-helix transcriptional regulator [Thaumarchaeota archaeon]|nr:winged helix-turn-helix transcriptional regulator [Nitrososphaerota archaeon]